jgi:hypothetical protein
VLDVPALWVRTLVDEVLDGAVLLAVVRGGALVAGCGFGTLLFCPLCPSALLQMTATAATAIAKTGVRICYFASELKGNENICPFGKVI